MPDDDYCYLTTTGRTSGKAHRIEIWYAATTERLYLMAGGGMKSDWVRNVVADPAVTVEIDGTEYPATGRVIEDHDEQERARALVFDKYQPRYHGGDLTDWRGDALPVALDLVDPKG